MTFALNGWWLHNRLSREQRDRPWVNMCHGIDVFSIEEQADYKAFIRDYCALTPKVVFTAVSDFLCARLAKAGVPERKIFKVPNAVSHQFREMRKTSGFWSGGRPLRVLSVGRLIGWKGHDILLRAVAMVRARHPETSLHVEIVYGRFRPEPFADGGACGRARTCRDDPVRAVGEFPDRDRISSRI